MSHGVGSIVAATIAVKQYHMNVHLFRPGTIFYEVILGAFKASGVSFEEWCRKTDVNPAAARSAPKGFSTGTQGQAVNA